MYKGNFILHLSGCASQRAYRVRSRRYARVTHRSLVLPAVCQLKMFNSACHMRQITYARPFLFSHSHEQGLLYVTAYKYIATMCDVGRRSFPNKSRWRTCQESPGDFQAFVSVRIRLDGFERHCKCSHEHGIFKYLIARVHTHVYTLFSDARRRADNVGREEREGGHRDECIASPDGVIRRNRCRSFVKEVHKTLTVYGARARERASALRRPLLTSQRRLIGQLSAGAYLLAQFLLSPRSQVHLLAAERALRVARGRRREEAGSLKWKRKGNARGARQRDNAKDGIDREGGEREGGGEQRVRGKIQRRRERRGMVCN